MKFQYKTTVDAPLDEVARFHQDSANMRKITPPPILVGIKRAPNPIFEGAEMEFTLWFGPIPVGWHARFEEISSTGFIDRQLYGPYKSWVHRHTFNNIGNGKTEIIDEIEAEFQNSPWWKLVGLLMWSGMPILFTYRAWKIRSELETANNSKNR